MDLDGQAVGARRYRARAISTTSRALPVPGDGSTTTGNWLLSFKTEPLPAGG